MIAVGLTIFEDHVLLAEGHDAVKGKTFYRGLGGEVEFGDHADDAVVRELLEELDRAVEVRALLGVIENHFVFEGEPGHEIVFEYVLEFAPGAAPADLKPLEAREGKAIFTAKWIPLAEVMADMQQTYPEGMRDRLAGWLNSL